MKNQADILVQQILKEDPRYPEAAYGFVLEALSFSQKKFRRQKHVSGKELLEGIKILLMERFGPMTLSVLKHWRIQKTDDFGEIVFNMVNKKVLSRTDEDNIEEFRDRYDFNTVFRDAYRKKLHKDISRLR